jgi:hypothetical protein
MSPDTVVAAVEDYWPVTTTGQLSGTVAGESLKEPVWLGKGVD